MPFLADSLEDVEAWAQHEFPTAFAALSSFQIAELVDTSKFDGEFVDGKIILQPILISALDVGVTAVGTTVYARITGSSEVEIFCDHMAKASQGTEDLWCIKPVEGLDGIKLAAPFRYCTQSAHPARLDRLETLIRYAYLKAGEDQAVQPKLGFFKAHFQGACRDVARGTGAVTEADEMDDDEILPGDPPPGLIEDTGIGGLRDNPVVTSIFNQYAHAMDESYHDFKTSMLRHIGAMQTMDQETMLQLQTQNQDLASRLAVAEEARAKMSEELETQKAETKSALEEVEKWKAHYEGLRCTLQDALGQRF